MKKYTLIEAPFNRVKILEDGQTFRYIPGGLKVAIEKLKAMIPDVKEIEVVHEDGTKEIKKI